MSVVRKSRDSSGGLYRCQRRSAHDGRRTNAMRFLMKTLLARPASRLIHAFPAKPSTDTLGSRRCLRVPCEAPLSPSEVTGVSQLQLSIFWRQFNPAFQSCWHGIYASKIAPCPRLRPIAHGTFPIRWATSGVDFVQPSSRSPRSPQSEITLWAAETYSTRGYAGLLLAETNFCFLG